MFDNISDFKKNFNWIPQVDDVLFNQTALTVFNYQSQMNPVYKAYLEALHFDVKSVENCTEIPFLPIGFFKTHKILCSDVDATDYFESSGTTSTLNSKHYLPDKELYKASFLHHFTTAYGKADDYVFLCLLPSYLERGNSSLVFMADELIKRSHHEESAFYLNEFEKLSLTLAKLINEKKQVILLGVTFALLDFAEAYPMDLSSVIVMETGGMKGRKEEWTRKQVHDFLKEKWNLNSVHSEYGMTELFSQAYSKGAGIYLPANLMKVSVRDLNDPLSNKRFGLGGLNIIDLGNLYSCAFIATEDIAKINENGTFEVRGRMDHSALRGCSLMAI